MTIGTAATVAIRELPGMHNIDLRVKPGTSAQNAVAEALAMELPVKPGQIQKRLVRGESEAYALCLAPDWWIISGFPEAEQKLAVLLGEPVSFQCSRCKRSANHY